MSTRWTEKDLLERCGDRYPPPTEPNGWQSAIDGHVSECGEEALIQKQAVERLLQIGYVVWVLDNGGHRLNTMGAADVLVAIPGNNRWIALEFKRPAGKGRPAGKLRQAQKTYNDQGLTAVVRTVAEALGAVAQGLGMPGRGCNDGHED